MKIGLGIDTGGTCTDAVLYDFESRTIMATSKAVTTKEDLSIGILAAIDSLPAQYLPEVKRVALSTTLATNACVENKGGRAKLIMMNAYRKVVADAGRHYGLPESKDIRFMDRLTEDISGLDQLTEIAQKKASDSEWDAFFDEQADWFRDAESIGVVELDAAMNSAVHEKDAKDRIHEKYGLPVIGSHELFAEPNVLQRGAGTLLNARLMPVINEFLHSVKTAMAARGIEAPVVIVRSDGTLMSESFTGVRPVETLLCGPAASVMGAMALSGAPDCLIVDMGGTTTDLAAVRNGIPLKAVDGVRIGKWKTYVRGVGIDTFGLGGDSEIRHSLHGVLHLDSNRIMPLSMAASRWPAMKNKLKQLLQEKRHHSLPLHTFYAPVRDLSKLPDADARFTKQEIAFSKILEKGPLIWADAAEAIGLDVYNLNMKRLEQEGIVIRCGLTPTDLMHVKGDFTRYDSEAAELGLRFVAASCDMEPSALVEEIYDRIRRLLYTRLVRLILEETDPWYRLHGLGDGLDRLISSCWDAYRGTPEHNQRKTTPVNPLTEWKAARHKPGGATDPLKSVLETGFHTSAVLVGIGAPTHLFLPEVARALGTECVLAEHAEVANALGAIISHVAAEITVDIRLEGGPGGFAGFRVRGLTDTPLFEEREDALAFARQEAIREAREEAIRRGAEGDITVTVTDSSEIARAAGGMPIELSLSVTATAVGSAAF